MNKTMNKTIHKTFYLATAFLLMHGVAFAQGAAQQQRAQGGVGGLLRQGGLLGQKVTTASRHGQAMAKAPGHMTVITAAEISAYGHRTVQEALTGIGRFYPNTALPGLRHPEFSKRVQVLLNGYKINDGLFGLVALDNVLEIPIDDIAAIEVAWGPGSSLYGSGAMAGVINIITRKGTDLDGTEVTAEARGNNTYRIGLSHGQSYGQGGVFLITTEAVTSKGRDIRFDELGNINSGLVENAGEGDTYKLFTSASQQGYTLNVGYLEAEQAMWGAPFGSILGASQNTAKKKKGFAELVYEKDLGQSRIVTSRAYYNVLSYDRTVLLGFDSSGGAVQDPALAVSTSTLRAEATGAAYGFETMVSETWLKHHYLTSGYSYHKQSEAKISYMDTLSSRPTVDIDEPYSVWAAFVQDEYFIGKFTLNTSLRYDKHPDFGETTNPKAALIYSPTAKTTFKVLYSEGYRAPDLLEKYYADGITQKANPGLRPEETKAMEFVVEKAVGTHFTGVVSLFKDTQKDLISLVTDPSDGLLQYQNIDKANIKGASAEFQLIFSRVTGKLAYTYRDSRDGQGQRLKNAPSHMGRASAAMPFFKNSLLCGLEVNYIGRRETLAGTWSNGEFLANVTLTMKPGKKFQASVGVYNLLDESYSYPALPSDAPVTLVPQAGRSFRAKLTYRF